MVATPRIRFAGYRASDGYRFELTSGHLALDLANTVVDRPAWEVTESLPRIPIVLEGRPVAQEELLTNHADLVAWARQSELLDRREATALSSVKEGEAKAALRNAVQLREAVFNAIAGHEVDRSLARLETFARSAAKQRSLVRRGNRIEWQWDKTKPDWFLAPVTEAAIELLTSPQRERVRICSAPGCRWLFIDRSRQGNRKWCDMTTCGNRQKAKRHYVKMRESS